MTRALRASAARTRDCKAAPASRPGADVDFVLESLRTTWMQPWPLPDAQETLAWLPRWAVAPLAVFARLDGAAPQLLAECPAGYATGLGSDIDGWLRTAGSAKLSDDVVVDGPRVLAVCAPDGQRVGALVLEHCSLGPLGEVALGLLGRRLALCRAWKDDEGLEGDACA